MRLYRAKNYINKRDIAHGNELLFSICPGQLFFVDTHEDLPNFDKESNANNDIEIKKDWEELDIKTVHGWTKIVGKM